MKISRVLAVLCAATLAPVALSVPAAHADQSWSGQVTSADPSAEFIRPVHATERCGSGADRGTFNYDSVTFTSTTDGPRRFVLHGGPGFQDFSIFVHVNGVCAKADDDTDNADEYTAKTIDVDNVQVAKGDKVEVRIIRSTSPWRLDVLQPGSSNGPTSGTATTYVALPEQVVCATGTASATLTKATRQAARKGKVRSIVFTANGQKVAKVKARGVRKAVKKGVLLQGIPKGAVTLDVVVKLKGGKKATASRPYSAC